MSVRRGHAAGVRKIPGAVRRADRDGAGQRHVAFLAEQALPRQMHRHERRGAGGLDCDAGPFQIQLVRDSRAEEILVIEDERRDVILREIPVQTCVHEIGVHGCAGENPDAS